MFRKPLKSGEFVYSGRSTGGFSTTGHWTIDIVNGELIEEMGYWSDFRLWNTNTGESLTIKNINKARLVIERLDRNVKFRIFADRNYFEVNGEVRVKLIPRRILAPLYDYEFCEVIIT